MAKEENGKIRGFYFEIDGSDATLQEGLRNFGAALGRALSGPQKPALRQLPPPKEKVAAASGEEYETTDTEVTEEDEFAPPPPPKPKKLQSTKKNQPIPAVLDLKLDQGSVPFKLFTEQKNPSSINDRVLVAAVWMKDYAKIEEITVDHLFTAFRYMNWNPQPPSYSQVLVDLRRKQQKFDKGSSPGAYRINLVGYRAVSEMGSDPKQDSSATKDA
jgi:hypothetical protein